jgi:CDP-diacylglycerol pyrophosphatase
MGTRLSPAAGVVLLALAGLAPFAGSAAAANRDALWTIVHDKCATNHTENPSPCALVDVGAGEDKGYAVLKDLVGATQYLVIPTRKITGIEDPAVLEPDAPNYWLDAWEARLFVFARAHKKLPREAIGLAVNSAGDRSQDQLHIHVDCLRPDVRQLLTDHAGEIGDTWRKLGVSLAGREYSAMRLTGADLHVKNPFRLLAAAIAGSGAVMADETLVVTGASFGEDGAGFILLADHADPATGDTGHGEDLQDHACVLASSLP